MSLYHTFNVYIEYGRCGSITAAGLVEQEVEAVGVILLQRWQKQLSMLTAVTT